jgi:hypothetical protein
MPHLVLIVEAFLQVRKNGVSPTRAKVILLSAAHPELTLGEIGAQVGLCDDAVGNWGKRFAAGRSQIQKHAFQRQSMVAAGAV